MHIPRGFLAACILLTLLTAAKACCLPDRFALHFLAELQGEKDGVGVNFNISGSVGADFNLKKFTLQYKVLHKPGRKIWVFDMSNGEYTYTYRPHKKPDVCKVGRTSGMIDEDYKCFLAKHEVATGSDANSYMVKLGNYAKIFGKIKQSDKEPGVCTPSGMNMFSGSAGLGNSITVKLLVTKLETGTKAGINFDPQCTDVQQARADQEFMLPPLDKLSKMSGKSVAALFGRVASDEWISPNPPTTTPTANVETGGGTVESGSGSGETGSGAGSGDCGGRYIWTGNTWVCVDDEGGDDSTDGSLSGSGGEEKVVCELPASLRGDVDCDGDYDEYDQDYWSYFWKDEDQSIYEMELEEERLEKERLEALQKQ